MALYKKAEFAEFCGVTKAHISMGIKRGKILVQEDDMVDSENDLNRLYKAKCNENGIRKQEPEKVAEIAEKPTLRAKKEKAPRPRADSTLKKRLEEKFDIEVEEKRARINKIHQEAQMSRLKEMKLTGQLIPTDLVYGTVRQLSQSLLMNFKNQLEAMITDISKIARLDRKQSAEMRKQIKEHLNIALNTSVDDAQRNIENITREYSQAKRAA